MSSTTVSEFAGELKKSTDTLLEQLKSAGVPKASASDVLTDSDKQKLLGFLQTSHGTATTERKKITLVKKSTTEIKQADATGKARTIQVEVRKKRTFMQRDDEVDASVQESAQSSAAIIADAELARREEEARRQAELLSRQEEELAERRRLREAQEELEMAVAQKAVAEANQAHNDVQKAGVAQEIITPSATKTLAQMQAEDAARKQAVRAEKDAVVANKTAVQVEKEAAAAAVAYQAKASADEAVRVAAEAKADDVARAKDLDERRRKALAEAEGIRAMMNAPKRVLVAKKPEEIKPVSKEGVKGTLHKPAGAPGAKPAAGTASPTSGPRGAKTEVKSEKLSSSWGGDPAKKKEIKTRGDASGGVGRSNWRGGPRGKRRGGDDDRENQAPAVAVETRVLEVHVPETITVAELAHKMAVKSSEVKIGRAHV